MSARFRLLLDEWKKADRQAAEAQVLLNAKFQAFVDGRGPEPTEEERRNAERLRTIANGSLEVALEYMKRASGGPTPDSKPGDLGSHQG